MAALNPFRDINITTSESHYTFRSPSTPDAPALVVSRPSGDLKLADSPALGGKRVTSIAGILGIITLRLDTYIIIITKAQLVGRICGHSVYKVQATEFLPMRQRQLHDPDEDAYLALLRTHLRTGPMYFSYTFDLTNSFQRQPSTNRTHPLWQRADDRFFWNRYIQSDLINFRNSNPAVDPYILPTFFGFLNISTTTLHNTPLTFILLTRRSRHRAGTRYFTRGIDSSGNVANFNETEQIVILGDSTGGLGGQGYDASSVPTASSKLDTEQVQIFSYVQTRGSIPVYWFEINTLKPIATLQVKPPQLSLDAARIHFSNHIRTYGDTYLVNLVNQSGREAAIKTAYETTVKSLVSSPVESLQASAVTPERFHSITPSKPLQPLDRLHYNYFDFHHECRSMAWHRASLLLDALPLATLRYFHALGTGTTSTIRSVQNGTVRTNCMDCLDRTNVVQCMLARWVLTRQMHDAGILSPDATIATFPAFETAFRNAWADNADVVSRSYSGTGALKTDFTRTGVRSRAGAIADIANSATRYLRNHFADGPRQDAFDLFLGVYTPSLSFPAPFADRRPVSVQAVPYILAASVFLVLAAWLLGDGGVKMKVFALFWWIVGAWAGSFVYRYGVLYVCWPVLNPPGFCVDAVAGALKRIKEDPVLGRLEKGGVERRGHERGVGAKGSVFRIEKLEEGKKRIE